MSAVTDPRADKDIEQVFTIPDGAVAGEKIELLMPDGKKFAFAVPDNVKPGDKIRLKVPKGQMASNAQKPGTETTPVTIPEGAKPGDKVGAVSLLAVAGDSSLTYCRSRRSASSTPPAAPSTSRCRRASSPATRSTSMCPPSRRSRP
jgi:hypothetical protein